MTLSSHIRAGLRSAAGGLPRPFWTIWAGIFVNRLGCFVVPFLAIYLTQVRGFSVLHAGVVVSLYGAGAAIAGPVGGYLADHVGRRFTMVLALGVGGAGMIALGFAHRIELIAPVTFLVAVVGEMYRPGMQAAVADLVPPADRVRAFGLVYWVINLGFAIGVTIGGLLATISYTLLFVGDGLTSMLFGLLVWRGVAETRPAHVAHAARAGGTHPLRAFVAPFLDPVFVAFLTLSFTISVVFMQHNTAFPLDMTAHGVSRAAIGAVLGLNGVLIVLIQPFLGPQLGRRDRSRTLAAGATLVGMGFGINALARGAPAYALGVGVWTIGEMAVLPVGNAVVADLAPTASRGRYQGAYGFSFGLAACVAPLLGTLALGRFGGPVLWAACLALGLATGAGQLALRGALARARVARMAAHAPAAAPPVS